MFLVFISETRLPYICTQVKGRTEIIWDSLAECEKERGWGEWMCSTFGLVSLDSSSNEELPGWTAKKTSGRKKSLAFFALSFSVYICLHTFLFTFPLLHYSLSPFVLFHLSVSSCQGSSLASAGRQTSWKQRTSGSRSRRGERERERERDERVRERESERAEREEGREEREGEERGERERRREERERRGERERERESISMWNETSTGHCMWFCLFWYT